MEQQTLVPAIPKRPNAEGRPRRARVTRMADALLAVVGAGRPPRPRAVTGTAGVGSLRNPSEITPDPLAPGAFVCMCQRSEQLARSTRESQGLPYARAARARPLGSSEAHRPMGDAARAAPPREAVHAGARR